MARPDPKAILLAAKSYMVQHPEELFRAVRGALGLRVGVPLSALRYLAKELAGGKKMPRDVQIEAVSPGLAVALTVDAAGCTLRVSLTVFVEDIQLSNAELRLGVRVRDLKVKVLEGQNTPVGTFISSGALDLSKPGNLIAIIPKKPPVLVDAKDDRLVLDLMKLPKIAENPKIKRILAIATPVLTVRAIRASDDHLDVYLRTMLSGIPVAVSAAKS